MREQPNTEPYATTYNPPKCYGSGVLSFASSYDVAVHYEGAHTCWCGCESYRLVGRLPKRGSDYDMDIWEMCACNECGTRFVRRVGVDYDIDCDGHREIRDYVVRFHTPESYLRKNTEVCDKMNTCDRCRHYKYTSYGGHCLHHKRPCFYWEEDYEEGVCPHWKADDRYMGWFA